MPDSHRDVLPARLVPSYQIMNVSLPKTSKIRSVFLYYSCLISSNKHVEEIVMSRSRSIHIVHFLMSALLDWSPMKGQKWKCCFLKWGKKTTLVIVKDCCSSKRSGKFNHIHQHIQTFNTSSIFCSHFPRRKSSYQCRGEEIERRIKRVR